MPLTRPGLYRRLVLDIELAASAGIVLATEGGNWSASVGPTSGRQPVVIKLPAYARGRQAQLTITPAGVMRLYGIMLHGRILGQAGEATWSWHAGPVAGTPEEWTDVKLPIPETPEGWTDVKLPIPETPEGWQTVAVPIPPTSDELYWAEVPVDE